MNRNGILVLRPGPHRNLHWKAQFDRITIFPDPVHCQKSKRSGFGSNPLAIDSDLRFLAPAGNAEMKRKGHRLIHLQRELNPIAERVFRLLYNAHVTAVPNTG